MPIFNSSSRIVVTCCLLISILAILSLCGGIVSKGSYGRGCQEKNSPFLPPGGGRLSDLHPAQRCGLAAYFLSLTRAVAGYISSVSCSDAGSTPSAREATQAEVLAEVTCQP